MAAERLTTLVEKSRQQPRSRELGEESVRTFGQLHLILQLQRSLGNRGVAELIQAKRLSPQGRLLPLQRRQTENEEAEYKTFAIPTSERFDAGVLQQTSGAPLVPQRHDGNAIPRDRKSSGSNKVVNVEQNTTGGGGTEIQRSPYPNADATPGNLPVSGAPGGAAPVSQRMSPAVRLETALRGSFTIDGFTNGNSDVPSTDRDLLTTAANTILSLLVKYPASTVRLVGHTDSVGKEEANQVLGQERANSVQAFLVKAGIPVEAIRSESRGPTDPAVNTRKPEPRNRRVEVRFEPSSLLAKFLPGVSLGNGSQDNPAPGVWHLPTDGDFPAPGLMTGDPAGISADKLWPNVPPAPHKPGKFDRYGVGKTPDPPDYRGEKDPDLGGAQGTHLSPTPDLLGLGRVGQDLFEKEDGPATKAP